MFASRKVETRGGLARASLHGVRERQVVGRVRHRDDAEGLQHRPPVRKQRWDERRSGGRGLPSFRRLVEAPAQKPADDAEDEAADERNAPAPGRDLVRGEERMHQPRRPRAEDEPECRAGRSRTADETARRCGGGFGRVDHRARELATDRETLDQSQEHEQQRRRDADGRVGRQQPDQERRHAHHRDRQHEQRTASDTITDPAEHQAADRTRAEAERKDRERKQLLRARARLREELLADDGREVAVHREVEPLEDVADQAGRGRAPRRLMCPGGGWACSFERLSRQRSRSTSH